MLEKIKRIQGINHNDFDSTIEMWIEAGRTDLLRIGIVDTYVNNPDTLIQTAIITYVLSQLDVVNAELYSNSYALQKDVLRHTTEYIVDGYITPTFPPITEPPTIPPTTLPPTEPPETTPVEEG